MNATISPAQLIQQLNWRYAVKHFDPARKIGSDDWAALEEALRLSPSSFGLQPWSFIVVKDPAVRAELRPVSRGQGQITEASHLVVFAARKNLGESDIDAYLSSIVEARGVPTASLAGYRRAMVGSLLQGMDEAGRLEWAKNQVFLALGNLLAAAALLGIDACPMEGFEAAKYDEILGLPQKNLAATVAAALGYRSPDDKYGHAPKVRFAKSQVFLEI